MMGLLQYKSNSETWCCKMC